MTQNTPTKREQAARDPDVVHMHTVTCHPLGMVECRLAEVVRVECVLILSASVPELAVLRTASFPSHG